MLWSKLDKLDWLLHLCGRTPPVQVAGGHDSLVASHVCTLINVLVVTRKCIPTTPVAGDTHCKCKWGLCTNWWQEKRLQCKLQRVKTILLVGTSRSRMQQPIAASTRAQSLACRPCPGATCMQRVHMTCYRDANAHCSLHSLVVFSLSAKHLCVHIIHKWAHVVTCTAWWYTKM